MPTKFGARRNPIKKATRVGNANDKSAGAGSTDDKRAVKQNVKSNKTERPKLESRIVESKQQVNQKVNQQMKEKSNQQPNWQLNQQASRQVNQQSSWQMNHQLNHQLNQSNQQMNRQPNQQPNQFKHPTTTMHEPNATQPSLLKAKEKGIKIITEFELVHKGMLKVTAKSLNVDCRVYGTKKINMTN